MKFRQYIPVKAAGGSPDPAVYCPANGYVDPDDPEVPYIEYPYTEAKGYSLVLTIQTNSVGSSFDPAVNNSNQPPDIGWDCDEGIIIMGMLSISVNYPDNSIKTVKVFNKLPALFTSVSIENDGIIGTVDLSNDIFKPLSSIMLYDNPGITEILFPEEFTAASFTNFRIYNTGFTGVLDLTTMKGFPSQFYLWTMPNMTGILFPTGATGNINQIYAYNTGLTGVLDLSMLSNFVTPSFRFDGNPNLTGILFTSSPITVVCSLLYIHSTGVLTLDLSMFVTLSAGANIYLYNNPNLTSIILPTVGTGLISSFRAYSNPNLGYIDIKGFSTAKASQDWQFQNNNWTADIVNHILADFDSISASGFTGRVINIGGTNADPDSSSGGYDGVAARNSLISKGFTVTIT